ncbi:MAG: TrkA family potassium uptake protein [Candidatus Margulisiibacteriota bacterium]|nr:MAG: hypothetical protein A2X43_09040 [Candidatus Margulisbacteria bacterium GWD2_39_127]OGI03569.1 MAG: hypothetical protein A2X42_00880 [Candidatus Margulisbacteria bacterium GWF2_38_17]OGI11074.1 MAG: hypothetical protein A2X41_02175 [Candidatus Margulisbacteria bacterium GWE2_39_32]PZM77073.1 MAG: TrkA family potassium uptake protein [Candidatus Margulisiibacteriota bacterium]HAR62330.1 potassium transporter [Candidatus Margulisiibacteriota bacterium]
MTSRRVAVIGLGQFGFKVATTLSQKGNEVIALDIDPEKVDDIKDLVFQAYTVDSTDEKALWAIGLDKVDIAIIAIGDNIQANLLTSALVKNMKVDKILARSVTNVQQQILKYIGVDEIINIEEQMGINIANTIATIDVEKYLEISPGHSLIEISAPPFCIGKKIGEINFRKNYNINVIAIKSKIPSVSEMGESIFEEVINEVPGADDVINDNDILMIIGSDENINNIKKGD